MNDYEQLKQSLAEELARLDALETNLLMTAQQRYERDQHEIAVLVDNLRGDANRRCGLPEEVNHAE